MRTGFNANTPMFEMAVDTAKVESILEAAAGVAQANVRDTAPGEAGGVQLTVEITPDAGGSVATGSDASVEADTREAGGKSPDGEGSLAALAREAEAHKQANTGGEPEPDSGGSGADCPVCGESFDSAAARNGHMAAHPDDERESAGEAEPDSGGNDPETPAEYMLAFGPCVAASDADGREPCGYGANGEDARMCPRHARMDEPALSVAAIEARQAWKNGDSEAVTAHIEEYAE